ncbi:MAG: hypothetical protein ACN4GZ_12490 [Acidimicrobiales bacterium]
MRTRFGSSPEPIPCGFAAAVADAERLAILLPERSDDDGSDVRDFGLGSVLLWARNLDQPLLVIAPADRAGAVARHALDFELISTWMLEGTSIIEVKPDPLPEVPTLSDATLARVELFASAGAVPIDDFGRLIAEVEGLEIARTEPGGEVLIGVGAADRELHSYVHGHQEISVSLAKAASAVTAIRRQGAAGHPLNRRARQRWLRSAAFARPELLGAGRLEMLPPLGERVLQLGPEPCAALDPDEDVLFVFSAGIDPEVVPSAADFRRRHRPTRTVIVTSESDAFPATAEIARSVSIETTTIPSPY